MDDAALTLSLFLTSGLLAVALLLPTLLPHALIPREPRSRADLVRGVRRCSLLTALLALLASEAGDRTSFVSAGRPADGSFAAQDGFIVQPLVPDTVDVPLLAALAAPALVLWVWAAAQASLPGQRGRRRRGALAGHDVGPRTPRGLLALALGVALLAGGMLAVLASEPGVPHVTAVDSSARENGIVARLPGSYAAGWLALSLAATIVSISLGLVAIRRRGAVDGLTPAEDGATRAVAANRLLRTGTWMAWLIAAAGWASLERIRESRRALAGVMPHHPAALHTGWGDTWLDPLGTAGGVLTAALVVVLLLWRSPAAVTLRQAERGAEEGVPGPQRREPRAGIPPVSTR